MVFSRDFLSTVLWAFSKVLFVFRGLKVVKVFLGFDGTFLWFCNFPALVWCLVIFRP